MYRTIDAQPVRAATARTAERAWQWCLAIADARRRGALPAVDGETSFALDDRSADRPRLVALGGAAAGDAVAPSAALAAGFAGEPPDMPSAPHVVASRMEIHHVAGEIPVRSSSRSAFRTLGPWVTRTPAPSTASK